MPASSLACVHSTPRSVRPWPAWSGGLGSLAGALAQLRRCDLTHRDLDRFGWLDRFARGDPERLDLAQLRQQAALHRADRGVIGVGCRGQALADFVEVVEELGEAGVHGP